MATPIHPLFETPLPHGWRLVTVDDVKSPEKSSCVAGPFGSNISSKYFTESGVPVIRGGNLRDDLTRFVPTGFAFVTEEQAKHYKAQHVRGGDLVFTCWGTVGQVGIIPEKGPFPEYIISNKQLKLRPNLELAEPLYLFFYFAGPKMVQHVLGRAIGAAVPGINLGILKQLPVVLPPLPVQRRIATMLSAYDELIANSRRRIQLLEAMAHNLYREWFAHFRFPGHEKLPRVASPLGDIPQGWEVKPLNDVVDDIVDYRGKTPTKLNGEWSDEGILALSALNVKGGRLVNLEKSRRVNEDLYSRWMKNPLRRGDILMTSEAPLGELYFLCKEERYCLSQRLYSIRANPKVIASVILYLCMESEQTQHELCSRASGATVSGIRQSELRNIPIVVPPRSVQERAELILQQLAEQKFTLDGQIKNLRQTRDLLLPRLLSGQVDLKSEAA